MRKKLLFCSALLLSASLAGCGYNDDNVRETVPALPESCSSTNECFVGSTGGQCVDGHCLRACEDRTDCEDGTICESGLCRHIVDCPEINLTSSELTKPNKCLKVFSHTPTLQWLSLMQGDLTQNTAETAKDFTSNNFTFQIPHASVSAGLTYSMIAASALSFIQLELIATDALMKCVMPPNTTSPTEYQMKLDKTKTVNLLDGSLFGICSELGAKKFWSSDFNNDLCDNPKYYFSSNFDETDGKDSADRCEEALYTWKTLAKVYHVMTQMSMNDAQEAKTPTTHAINWVLSILKKDKVTDIHIQPQTLKVKVEDKDKEINLQLPKIQYCTDLMKDMQNIQETICNDIMAGIMENPLTNLLGSTTMDLVTCMSHENTATSLIKNGWDLTKVVETPQTIEGIATALIEILKLENSQYASYFTSISTMLKALGDPTYLWFTEDHTQQLNIISTSNEFANNDLMLAISYTPTSLDITTTPVQFDQSTTNDKNVTTQPFAGKELHFLATKPNDSSTYPFFITTNSPSSKAVTKPLICGGVSLDISAISGYVVLTDNDIATKGGTALVINKK